MHKMRACGVRQRVDDGEVTIAAEYFGNASVADEGGQSNTHNVAIDEASGFLYRLGDFGMRVYNISGERATAPQFISQIGTGYIHDGADPIYVFYYLLSPYLITTIPD